MRIRTKLLASYCIVLLLMLIIGSIALFSRNLFTDKLTELSHIAKETHNVQEIAISIQFLLMPANDYLISGDSDEKDKYRKNYDSLMLKVEDFKDLNEKHFGFLKQLQNKIKLIDIKAKAIFAIPSKDVFKRRIHGTELMYNMDKAGDDAYVLISKHAEEDHKQLNIILNDTNNTMDSINIIMIVASFIIVFVGIVFVWYFDRSIREPIEKLSNGMKGVAHGRWANVTLRGNGELINLATEFNLMVDRISNFHGELEAKVKERTIQLDNLNKKLKNQAITDGLTGLYNHRYFYEQLQAEVDRSIRNKDTLVLIMIDIDYFKIYNDNFGHIAGDDVLKRVAKCLKKASRKYDIVARYGGEEFTIIAPNMLYKEALEFALRIQKSVAGTKFPNQEKMPDKNLTISLGVSVFPKHSDNSNDLLKKADVALYKAKNKGRNCAIMAKK